LVVDVDVEKFWQWNVPGAWTVQLNANILTKVTLKTPGGRKKTEMVAADSSTDSMVAGGKPKLGLINALLEDYVQEFKAQID